VVTNALSDIRFATDQRFPSRQVLRLISAAIARHDLDLREMIVLTEAAVGYERVTPVIAALAGAQEVYAVGRDTPAAARRDAEAQTAGLARAAGVQERVHLLSTRLQAPLNTIDIITNLPGVRPIDEAVLRTLPATAAVSLMSSAAAWQAADVDVAACRRMGIAVAGIDEDALDLHRFAGLPVIAMLLELGVGIVGTTIMMAGDGIVYANIVRALSSLGARVLVAAPDPAGRVRLNGGQKVGAGLKEPGVQGHLAECDALIVSSADMGHAFVGPGGDITAREIAQLAPHLAVVCVGGTCDQRGLEEAGLRSLAGGTAAAAPGELAPEPVIELRTAGLNVGAAMAHSRRRGSSPLAAEAFAAETAGADLLPKELPQGRRPS
jgi:hypothetical protein